jgi:hypothetical protein
LECLALPSLTQPNLQQLFVYEHQLRFVLLVERTEQMQLMLIRLRYISFGTFFMAIGSHAPYPNNAAQNSMVDRIIYISRRGFRLSKTNHEL